MQLATQLLPTRKRKAMALLRKIIDEEKSRHIWFALLFCFSVRCASSAVNWILRFY